MEVSALHIYGDMRICNDVIYHTYYPICRFFNSLNKSAYLLARRFAKLDVLAPLICADLKRLLHTACVVSMG